MHRFFRLTSRLSRRSLLFLLLVIVVGVYGMAGGGATVWAQDSGPTGAAYRGASIFSERCAECHGPQGLGDGSMAGQMPVPMPDFADPTFGENRSPQAIFEVIREGRIENLMPPWGNALSEGQMWDAAAFIWSLHIAPADVRAGRTAYSAACAECHGFDGLGTAENPEAGSLASPALLALNEPELLAALGADAHPPVEGLAEPELRLAAATAREFSLGFLVETANVTGNGTIDIIISNGSTGASAAGLPVQLYILDGNEVVDVRDAETGAEGSALFEGLPTEPSWTFVVETLYKGVPYDSDMVQFDPAAGSLSVPLSVYEAGATIEDIRIERAHWVVSLEMPTRVDIGEVLVFANTGNQVYLGASSGSANSPVLDLYLPPNAFNVSFDGGDLGGRFIQNGDKISDLLPMPPGQRQIFFRYSLPVEDGEVELAHAYAYPINSLNLLMPDMGVDVNAPGWIEGEPRQTQGGAYLNFTADNLPAGDSPAASLSGIESDLFASVSAEPGRQIIDANATPGISGQSFLPFLIAALSVLVLGAGTYYALQRQRQFEAGAPARRQQQKEALTHEIADLDDDYAEGEISETDYQAERQLLKARLLAVMSENAR